MVAGIYKINVYILFARGEMSQGRAGGYTMSRGWKAPVGNRERGDAYERSLYTHVLAQTS